MGFPDFVRFARLAQCDWMGNGDYGQRMRACQHWGTDGLPESKSTWMSGK
jgi:hypothetical protein